MAAAGTADDGTWGSTVDRGDRGVAARFRDVLRRGVRRSSAPRPAVVGCGRASGAACTRSSAEVPATSDLERVRTSFIAAASHELRTPTAVLTGAAETLRVHHGRLDLDTEEALLAAEVARRPPGTVTTGPLPSLVGEVDACLLVRAVQLLLDNVERHAAGPAHLTVQGVGRTLRIQVEDDGPGIAEAWRTEVLAPFGRVPDDHHAPGVGLGLYLVAEIARLHGGHAEVADAAGGGTRVTLELPDALPPSATADGPSAARPEVGLRRAGDARRRARRPGRARR